MAPYAPRLRFSPQLAFFFLSTPTERLAAIRMLWFSVRASRDMPWYSRHDGAALDQHVTFSLEFPRNEGDDVLVTWPLRPSPFSLQSVIDRYGRMVAGIDKIVQAINNSDGPEVLTLENIFSVQRVLEAGHRLWKQRPGVPGLRKAMLRNDDGRLGRAGGRAMGDARMCKAELVFAVSHTRLGGFSTNKDVVV